MKIVLCIPRNRLFAHHYFEGFCSTQKHNFLPIITKEARILNRTDQLEQDPAEKQLITYTWILNPEKKTVLVYQRAHNQAEYAEKRLLSKWSAGIGGHIEEPPSEHAIMHALNRELQEEVTMRTYPVPRIIGFVNIDSEVEEMHLGIVAIAETTEDVRKGDDEMSRCLFVTKEKLDAMMTNPEYQFEKWTKATWPVIRDTYLS